MESIKTFVMTDKIIFGNIASFLSSKDLIHTVRLLSKFYDNFTQKPDNYYLLSQMIQIEFFDNNQIHLLFKNHKTCTIYNIAQSIHQLPFDFSDITLLKSGILNRVKILGLREWTKTIQNIANCCEIFNNLNPSQIHTLNIYSQQQQKLLKKQIFILKEQQSYIYYNLTMIEIYDDENQELPTDTWTRERLNKKRFNNQQILQRIELQKDIFDCIVNAIKSILKEMSD